MIEIKRIQDIETGKWKVYGYDRRRNLAAWIWSSYEPPIPVYLRVEKPRQGIVGAFLDLFHTRYVRERFPDLKLEVAEFERCQKNDEKKIRDLIFEAGSNLPNQAQNPVEYKLSGIGIDSAVEL